MPKCGMCQTAVPAKTDLTLVRNNEGRWVVVCAACLRLFNKGAGGDAQPTPTVPPAASQPEPDVSRGGQHENGAPTLRIPKAFKARRIRETQEAFEKIRETLKELHADKRSELRAHERAHERHDADLTVHFALQRDDVTHKGRVRDISQGGMRFVTTRTLTAGQILHLEVNTPNPEASKTILQSTGEVRRVRDLGDGAYEVGIRFVRRMRGNEANRRRFKRYQANMAAYYTREGSEYTVKGRVCDISQGGVRLLLDEAVEKGEEFALLLRGEGKSALKADLAGLVRVMRVKHLGAGEYEVGCSFLQIGVHANPGDEQGSAAEHTDEPAYKDNA